MNEEFLMAFDRLPLGTFTGSAHGRRYVVTRQEYSDGNSHKLVAEELGDTDYISLNLYRLKSGVLLKPCEMPAVKVVEFVLDLVPD